MQGHSGPGWAAFWGETDTAMNCPVGVQQLQILRVDGRTSRPKNQTKSLRMNSHKSQATATAP